MATDATGTPTSLGIPKYNTAADAPSGKGFNAAMDSIDALILQAVRSADSKAANEVPVWDGSAWQFQKILNAQVDAAAAIAVSKLAPGTNGQILTTTGGAAAWGSAASGATVATTVAGLGTASNGQIGLLRVGASPYGFVRVVFDSTLSKWVSDPILHAFHNDAGTTTSTSFVMNGKGLVIPHFKAIYDTGLRPQFCAAASFRNNASALTTVRAAIYELSSGETTSTLLGGGGDITHNTNTATFKASNWADPGVAITAPAKDFGFLVCEWKVASGTGVFDATPTTITTDVVGLRWVAASA